MWPHVLTWNGKWWPLHVPPVHGLRVLLLSGRTTVSHSPWGCLGQSADLWDGPLAWAWLRSVEPPCPFFSSPISKPYSCSRFPHSLSRSFQCIAIPASWDFSPLRTRRIFSLYNHCVLSLSHTHPFCTTCSFLFSQCGVFLARSFYMGTFISSFTHPMVWYWMHSPCTSTQDTHEIWGKGRCFEPLMPCSWILVAEGRKEGRTTARR